MAASDTIRASVLHGARDLRVEERSVPQLGADEVEVAVRATGLCGSDLHYFNHYRNGDILVREPLTLGHESAGVVTAVGTGVSSSSSSSSPSGPALRVGDRVALEVGQPCGECALCREGRYNICRDMSFRSSAKSFPHAQGTLQERIVHPARWCYRLPENVPLELGALVEPLSVALHAADRANLPVSPEDDDGSSGPVTSVLVFGAGAVGLLCAAVSKVVSRARVVIADIQADRVRFAVDNGFADAGVVVPLPDRRPETVAEKLDFARQVAALVREAKWSGGDETVGEVTGTYECTGVESCLQAGIYATAPGGKVMIIGMGNPIQTLPVSAASLREVDLVGVFRYANTYPRVIELLASRDPRLPPVEKLITQRFSGFDNIPKAFDMAARVKDEEGNLVIKVMVDM